MDILSLLKECYELRTEIIQIEEKIEEINALLYYPKIQQISDMPKGGGGNSEEFTDKLITKREKLKKCEKDKELEFTKKWCIAIKAFRKSRLNTWEVELLTYRYYWALPWKKCGDKMKDFTGQRWNENRIFRVYGKAKEKLSKYS